ncbi:MAG: PfkB family carbohydrate kinase [Coriobacteriaceae bacterium]|nr:PfkB family carbohydrate kinase [Coriobacteriaceae bacterium]
MGKILFVGVTCADVVINVDRLPRTAEDVVVYGQHMALGGCAFNAFFIAHALGEPAVLFSPVGTGAFGDFVRKGLTAEGIPVAVENPSMENGCCYCFVEPGGERTFVAYHGADYHYEPAWFDALNMDEIDAVYVCGLEIEDPTGSVVVAFLERQCAGKQIFFTPGPRPDAVPIDLLNRIYDLHPILHLNNDEAVVSARRLGVAVPDGSGPEAVACACAALRERVGNAVFATLGKDGCYVDDGSRAFAVPGVSATVVDTIGAGDSHIGALMACLHRGDALEDAMACANRVAAAVVSTAGAHLSPERVREAARV